MLTKEEFLNSIDELKECYEKRKKLDEALDEYFDTGYMLVGDEDAFCAAVRILGKAMQDEGDWIPYLVFEKDWLRDFAIGDAQYPEGCPIDLSSWEKVYYFLQSEALS